MPGKCKFQDSWLSKEVFQDWLEKDAQNVHVARCRACCKSIKLENMGEAALTSHAGGAGHKVAVHKLLEDCKRGAGRGAIQITQNHARSQNERLLAAKKSPEVVNKIADPAKTMLHSTICRDGHFPTPIYEAPQYKCKICSKTGEYAYVVAHMQTHEKTVLRYGGFKMYRCQGACTKTAHYHCCYCARTVTKQNSFLSHVHTCEAASSTVFTLASSMTTGSTITVPSRISTPSRVILLSPVSVPSSVSTASGLSAPSNICVASSILPLGSRMKTNDAGQMKNSTQLVGEVKECPDREYLDEKHSPSSNSSSHNAELQGVTLPSACPTAPGSWMKTNDAWQMKNSTQLVGEVKESPYREYLDEKHSPSSNSSSHNAELQDVTLPSACPTAPAVILCRKAPPPGSVNSASIRRAATQRMLAIAALSMTAQR
ncbi:uncharacterized protein fsbp isoform 2-T2 [Pholidichthys leucotaenia]